MLDSMGYNSDMLTTKWGNKNGISKPEKSFHSTGWFIGIAVVDAENPR